MFLRNSENHVHFIELSGRRRENRQGLKCLNPDKNHAPFTHSQNRCHVFHLQIWPPSHVSTNSVSKKLYEQVHFKHAEDSTIVFLCVLCPNAEGVSGVNEEKQDLPIKLLLASKSSQTQRVLTFNPLDLREMNRMPSEWVNVPHSLCVWNNNKRIMRRLVLQGAKMCFRCGNMQPRLSLLPMN